MPHEDFTYEYLSGTINIPIVAPKSWKESGLSQFYKDPNNPQWGESLCRVLYHETLHFWQFLSSGYIANLVVELWHRLNYFERTGIINPASEQSEYFNQRHDNNPFSASELSECWARYWDVHTRSPTEIIKQEKIKIDRSRIHNYETGGPPGYSEIEFDTLMQKGKDCVYYAMPYRWSLETANGNSFLVNSVFPIITHIAFLTSNPVENFCEMFTHAIKSNRLKKGISSMVHIPNINLSWLTNWDVVIDAVKPLIVKNRINLTTGIDVIKNTLLSQHPIFCDYIDKFLHLPDLISTLTVDPKSSYNEFIRTVANLAIARAKENPLIVFALPGQPEFRYVLGLGMQSPIIHFSNFTYYAERSTELTELDRVVGLIKNNEHIYQNISKKLRNSIKIFEDAENAS